MITNEVDFISMMQTATVLEVKQKKRADIDQSARNSIKEYQSHKIDIEDSTRSIFKKSLTSIEYTFFPSNDEQNQKKTRKRNKTIQKSS